MVAETVAPGAAFKSLSSNDAIQFILGDIPLYTVGILALGTFTFFFFMKRVDRWVFCIHLSVFLAFLAAIFDLSQLLIRGSTTSDDLTDDLPPGASGLITAREVFYAFSNSLRFLFYWGFVALIPLGETIPEGNQMHSASWRRWGFLGIFLKWATLLIQVVMLVLQLLYRNVAKLAQIGPVYEAESTLEIILSAVFILKLLLNTLAMFPVGTATQSKGKMLVQYAPIIVALLFSLWIAVGNAILFEFTETALGRFMRAVEFYIVIVYVLTISFHHLRHLSFFPVYRPPSKQSLSRADTFDSFEKPGAMIEALPMPHVEPPRTYPQAANLMEVLEERYRAEQSVPPTIDRSSAKSAQLQNANQHQSMAARLSTWLLVGRPGSRAVEKKPWDIDTERGPSPVAEVVIQPWDEKPRPESEVIRPLDEDERRGVSPLSPYGLQPTRSDADTTSVAGTALIPPSSNGAIEDGDLDSQLTPIPDRDWQDVEFSNAVRYSGVNDDVVAQALKTPHRAELDTSSVSSAIQVISPPSDEGSRPGSVGSIQYAMESYPGSPLASAAPSLYPMSPMTAVATPVGRSRPLPPMPAHRPSSSLTDAPLSPMAPDSARSSNISMLLRRQNELDESIAALKKFSPSQQTFNLSSSDSPLPATTEDDEPSLISSLEEQLASGGRSVSPVPSTTTGGFILTSPELPLPLTTPRTVQIPDTSAQSEFYFDQQPPLNRSSMDSGVIPVPLQPFQGYEEEVPTPTVMGLAPPRQPVSRFSDGSSIGDRRERRVDSVGTQYDITSFVGNLTTPVNPTYSMMSAAPSLFSSEEGFVEVATVARPGEGQFVRPTIISPAVSPDTAHLATLALADQFPAVPSARRVLPQVPQLPIAQSQSQPQSQSPTQSPTESQASQSPQRSQRPGAQTKPSQPPPPRFRRAVGLPAHPRLSMSNLTPVEERPSDTSSLESTPRGSGTPSTGRAW